MRLGQESKEKAMGGDEPSAKPAPSSATIRCGFCGHEFAEAEGNVGCKNCPMSSGCKMIKCPRCNYENPPEPALVKGLKKLFGTK